MSGPISDNKKKCMKNQAQTNAAECNAIKARAWTCPACRIHHDWDINAAKNIQQVGL
ncbi:zinc ribbon domain-containing protein [Caldalkalibacillus uzonensis]|uniref:zinc ribbon domain-containing protein n=1 Tax=Caldalkalibacillus uzonensis TaxID=353224 RepID=UPI003F9A35D7